MSRVVFDGRVVRFVASRIGGAPGECTAVGLESDEGIVAGVIFERCNGHNVFFHDAAVDGYSWTNRDFLKAIAYHAFNTMGVPRVTTVVASSNLPALGWDLQYGFVEEGRLKGAAHDGSDSVYLVLWKDKCKWLNLK